MDTSTRGARTGVLIDGLDPSAESDDIDLGPTQRPRRDFPEPPPVERHGPGRVVAMCNQKGGVGKTTTTINLGAALADYGRRVLLVDFDPQGALSVGLGVDAHDLELSVYNLVMERGIRAEDILLKTSVRAWTSCRATSTCSPPRFSSSARLPVSTRCRAHCTRSWPTTTSCLSTASRPWAC